MVDQEARRRFNDTVLAWQRQYPDWWPVPTIELPRTLRQMLVEIIATVGEGVGQVHADTVLRFLVDAGYLTQEQADGPS